MNDMGLAISGIESFRRWMYKIGCPLTLRELGFRKKILKK